MELEHLDTISRSVGSTLTPQERSNIEMGAIKRHATENIETLRFWGKIAGETQDYVICVAYVEALDVPKKKFFFWYTYI